ncbi:MAG: 3-oxoacyl-[acyl-carrier protein] reductase [Chloroflexota bacterium]|jgi:3-oxoacyl-[acyl-carrier protein] reductase|nr:3-oxoacyl-[acyl-carrier protein] reductase [Chloroflexota bacterium]
MDLGLAGRVAVVGGGSSGLGLATARRLAAEGCDLLIWARNDDGLAAAARDLGAASGRRIETLAADATDPGAAERVAGRALDAFGHVDVLVLNAGGPPPTDPTALTTEQLRAAYQLLTVTPIELANLLLPGMRERRWGRVVAILSWGVREPIPQLALSNMGRGALAAWLKTTSRWVGPDGVTLNGVLPGRFATPRIAELDAQRASREGRSVEEIAADARSAVPAGRDGDPDELGAVVAFLASEPAGYITGAFVPVDGGLLQSLG